MIENFWLARAKVHTKGRSGAKKLKKSQLKQEKRIFAAGKSCTTSSC